MGVGFSASFWIAVTLCVWLAAGAVHRLLQKHPLANPIITAIAMLLFIIYATGENYSNYSDAMRPMTILVGPATVSLAIPVHAQGRAILSLWFPIAASLLAGAFCSLLGCWVVGHVFDLSSMAIGSLLPKSVTAPVAMALAPSLGGSPALAMTGVLISGITGSLVLPFTYRRDPGSDNRGWAFSAGLGAHAFGVARALQADAASGAIATMGMVTNAILTAIILSIFYLLK